MSNDVVNKNDTVEFRVYVKRAGRRRGLVVGLVDFTNPSEAVASLGWSLCNTSTGDIFDPKTAYDIAKTRAVKNAKRIRENGGVKDIKIELPTYAILPTAQKALERLDKIIRGRYERRINESVGAQVAVGPVRKKKAATGKKKKVVSRKKAVAR